LTFFASVWACTSGGGGGGGGGGPVTAGTTEGDAGGVMTSAQQDASLSGNGGEGGTAMGMNDGGTMMTTATNPIAGIGALKEIAAGTEAPGGYYDSVRAWYDAGTVFTDPSSGAAGGGILFINAHGASTPFRTPDNSTLGIAIDQQRLLLAAESNVGGSMAGRVTRSYLDGGFTVVADSWDAGGFGVPFDSPNDLTVRKSDGTIFFTDPGYQNPDAGLNRVFAIDPSGYTTIANECDNLCRPNGIAISKDEKTLFVAFSGPFADKSPPYIEKFPIKPDNTLDVDGSTKFADVGDGLDGIGIDDDGNVYAAYSGGVAVFDKNGNKWGVIAVPKTPTNVAFGNPDRNTLFITANAANGPSIYTVKVNVPGRVE
jgi:gluconolactonase